MKLLESKTVTEHFDMNRNKLQETNHMQSNACVTVQRPLEAPVSHCVCSRRNNRDEFKLNEFIRIQ